MLWRFLLSLLLALTARGEVARVTVGGVALRLPAPEGFVRYDGKSDKVDAMQAGFLPASHRILAAYGEEDDVSDVQAGKFPRLERSLNVQENWQFEGSAFPVDEFATVRAALREQMGRPKNAAEWPVAEVERSASSAVSHELAAAMKVTMNDTIPLGVFGETAESTCFALLVKSHLKGGALEATIDPVTVVAGCVILVRGRLLYLYANAMRDGKADENWARQQVTAWRDAVVAANAPGAPAQESLPPEPMEGGGRDWWRRRKVWVAALVVAAGLGWALRRKPLQLPG